MWLFTTHGFFSVVENDDRTNGRNLLIRARRRSDLKDLLSAIGGGPAIFEDQLADYRYRLVVNREKFARYMADQVMGLDYQTSVKTALDKGETDRHSAMMSVWSAMGRLQPGGPYSRGLRPQPKGQGRLDLEGSDWSYPRPTGSGTVYGYGSTGGTLTRQDDGSWREQGAPAGLFDDLRLADGQWDDPEDVFNRIDPEQDPNFDPDSEVDSGDEEVYYRIDETTGDKLWFDAVTDEFLGVWA